MMVLGFMDSFILTSHCPLAASSGARTRAQHAAARWCAPAPHAAARAPVRGVIGVAGAAPRSSATPLRPSPLLQLPLPSPLRRARVRGARAFGAPGRAGGPAPCAERRRHAPALVTGPVAAAAAAMPAALRGVQTVAGGRRKPPPRDARASGRRPARERRHRARAGGDGGRQGTWRRAYDAVGDWLVEHPAPMFLVHNPLKDYLLRLRAGQYDKAEGAKALDAALESDLVVLFSQTYCPFSKAVKRELDARSVPYTTVEVDVVPEGNMLVNELGIRTGRTSIPHVFIGGDSVGGCNDSGVGGTGPGFRQRVKEDGWLEGELRRAKAARDAA